MSGVNTIIVGIGVLLIYLLIFGVGIADYVVSSIGLYKLASKRQIEKPWFAWLPVVGDLLLGRVTEDCDAREGKHHKWSTVMLVLALVSVCGVILFFTAYFIMIFVTVMQVSMSNGDPTGALVVVFIVIMIAAMIMGIGAAAYAACRYICVYKIFESIAPEKTLKYFLLAIMVPLAYGILLMKCCKSIDVEPIEEQPLDEFQPEKALIEETQVTEAPVDVTYGEANSIAKIPEEYQMKDDSSVL